MTENDLVVRVREYWQSRGFQVMVAVMPCPITMRRHGDARTYAAVRSNMLNGLPNSSLATPIFEK